MNSSYRKPIDPFAYTHSCDHSASYEPKRTQPKQPAWTGVSDMTGRGFVREDSTLTKGMVRPRETIKSPENLDQGNRFFSDNKRILNQYYPRTQIVKEEEVQVDLPVQEQTTRYEEVKQVKPSTP